MGGWTPPPPGYVPATVLITKLNVNNRKKHWYILGYLATKTCQRQHSQFNNLFPLGKFA